MNFMKRAFLYVSRKRGKSILLFFILLILSTFVLTGLSIGSASKQAQKNLRQNIGGSFNIDVNYSYVFALPVSVPFFVSFLYKSEPLGLFSPQDFTTVYTSPNVVVLPSSSLTPLF